MNLRDGLSDVLFESGDPNFRFPTKSNCDAFADRILSTDRGQALAALVDAAVKHHGGKPRHAWDDRAGCYECAAVDRWLEVERIVHKVPTGDETRFGDE